MIWKWLLVAGALFVLYKLFMSDRSRDEKKEAKVQERKIAAGEMVKDPVCETYVEVDSSIKVRDGDEVHHFCSYDCRQKFLDRMQDSGREIPRLDKKDDD
jgi:YHS domain-containing protein